jgi:hypothetical protein
MKRYTWVFFLFIILSLIVGGCAQAEPPPAVDEGEDQPDVEAPPAKPFEGQTLRLLTWEGYVPGRCQASI